MSQRLSRKEIKRDEFMETMAGAFEWVQQHSRALIGAALALLVVGILGALFYAYSARQERLADEALAKALRVYQTAVDPATADPTDAKTPTFADSESRSRAASELLRAVRDNFKRSDAATIAGAYLGHIAIQSGDSQQARSLWQEYIDRAGDDMLSAEVRVNLMALDRAEGKGDELVTRLRAMLSGPESGLPHDLLWYQLALTLESLGRDAEAAEAYQRIVEDYPQSAYAAKARQRSGATQTPLFGT
jgi:tetratricopeptide (TPR) repeat protein